MHITLHAMANEIACRAFPITLSGDAWEWFRCLMPYSVGTFKDLARTFLTHFLGSQERMKPLRYLLTLHRREGESLNEFMIRFNPEKLKVEDLSMACYFPQFTMASLPRNQW